MGGALFRGRATLMEKKMLRVREVADELRARGFDITERAVREEIKAKRLPAYKLRETYYISREDLETFIEGLRTTPDDDVTSQVAC